jgi:hypothetical protein
LLRPPGEFLAAPPGAFERIRRRARRRRRTRAMACGATVAAMITGSVTLAPGAAASDTIHTVNQRAPAC